MVAIKILVDYYAFFPFKWHKLHVKIFNAKNNKLNGIESERTTWVGMPFVRMNRNL